MKGCILFVLFFFSEYKMSQSNLALRNEIYDFILTLKKCKHGPLLVEWASIDIIHLANKQFKHKCLVCSNRPTEKGSERIDIIPFGDMPTGFICQYCYQHSKYCSGAIATYLHDECGFLILQHTLLPQVFRIYVPTRARSSQKQHGFCVSIRHVTSVDHILCLWPTATGDFKQKWIRFCALRTVNSNPAILKILGRWEIIAKQPMHQSLYNGNIYGFER